MARKKTPPQNPLSAEDEAKFDFFMEKWRKALNLLDWRYIKRAKHSAHMAEILEQDTESRTVTWAVGKDFGNTPVTPVSLEQTAVHENLHVLLHSLVESAYTEGEYNENVVAEEHRVIAVLEPLLQRISNLT